MAVARFHDGYEMLPVLAKRVCKGVQRLETGSGHMAHIDRTSGVERSIEYTSVVPSASCQRFRLFRSRWAGVGGQNRTNVGIQIREPNSEMAISRPTVQCLNALQELVWGRVLEKIFMRDRSAS